MKQKDRLKLITMVVFIIFLIFMASIGMYVTDSKYNNREIKKTVLSFTDIKTGLDISGGITAVYRPELEGNATAEEMSKAKTIMRKRLDDKSLYDANVIADLNNNWIEIEIPNETDTEAAISGLGQTAKLEFKDPEDNVILDGANIKKASYQQGQDNVGTTQVYVLLEFDDEGKEKFSEATTRLVGQSISICMDEEVISSPTVNEPITDGNATITIGGTDIDKQVKEAAELANIINSGSLPFSLKLISSSTVGPTLGVQSLRIIMIAAAVGVLAIIAVMIWKYKLLGMVASVSLLAYISLVVLMLANTGITMTLPGIAGIILSISMAIDANILIYEGIKEELRKNRNIEKAVSLGFKHASSSIVDGNIILIIVALALYLLGAGPVKSFGIILFIGVIINILTTFVLTRYILLRISKIFNKNKALYGVKREVQK